MKRCPGRGIRADNSWISKYYIYVGRIHPMYKVFERCDDISIRIFSNIAVNTNG